MADICQGIGYTDFYGKSVQKGTGGVKDLKVTFSMQDIDIEINAKPKELAVFVMSLIRESADNALEDIRKRISAVNGELSELKDSIE